MTVWKLTLRDQHGHWYGEKPSYHSTSVKSCQKIDAYARNTFSWRHSVHSACKGQVSCGLSWPYQGRALSGHETYLVIKSRSIYDVMPERCDWTKLKKTQVT